MSENEDSNGFIDNNMYEVQAILDKKFVNGKPYYLVKWLHWDNPQDATWEPLENLVTVQDLVDKYEDPARLSQMEDQGKKKINKRQRSDKKNKSKDSKQKKQSKEKKENKEKKEKRESKEKKEKKRAQTSPSQRDKKQKSPKQSKSKSKLRLPKPLLRQTTQILISDSSHDLRVDQQDPSQQGKLSQHNSSQPPSNKPVPKKRINCINHIYIKQNGQKLYEVDIVNREGHCIGVRLVSSKELRRNYKKMLKEFLENYLKEEQIIKLYDF